MRFLKFCWSILKRFGRWWNRNATKRWLLALDRFSICYMFTVILVEMIDYAGTSVVLTEDVVALVCVAFLFIILYTPSYMYPNSSEPVRCPHHGDLDDDGQIEKDKP